jgi:hypothetical protein
MNCFCVTTGGSGILGVKGARFLLRCSWRECTLDIAPFNYPERGMIEALDGDIRHREVVEGAVVDASILVQRGRMCDDPLVFAPKDK